MRGLDRPTGAKSASHRCFNDCFKAVWLVSFAIVAWMFFLPAAALAQEEAPASEEVPFDWSLDPIFPNSADGEVIGLSGDITFQGFTPFTKLGWDLSHNALRYQAGVAWMGLSASVYDWADPTVLGRSGQSGIMGKLDIGFASASVRTAQLWLIDEEDISPEVQYLNTRSSHTFKGEADFSLTLSSNYTVGSIMDQEGTFESTNYSMSGRWGDFLFQASTGTSSNEAGLNGFEFTRRVHGYEESLKGHSYAKLRLDRRVPLLVVPMDFNDLFESLPEGSPELGGLTFKVEASGFGDMLHMQPNPGELDVGGDLIEPQSQIGWGVGLVLGFEEFPFEVRFDLFFNQLGEMKPLFG